VHEDIYRNINNMVKNDGRSRIIGGMLNRYKKERGTMKKDKLHYEGI